MGQATTRPDSGPDDFTPLPQPERTEPPLAEPGLTDLSLRDYRAVLGRAGKEFLADNGPLMAQALAYSTFFAVPSVLLVVAGLFTLIAGPDTITSLMQHFSQVVPKAATQLLSDSLTRLDAHPAQGVLMTLLGFLLATWSTTGAMTAYMTAVNLMYDRQDRRSFLRKRLVAAEMALALALAFLLVAGLLILGPVIEHYVGQALNAPTLVAWIWWVGQWPLLILGLLTAFAAVLYLGPDVDQPQWRFLTPGSLFAALVWLALSGLFAFYTSSFGSYNKTWGSLSAVIVLLTWLWLSGLALLFGAELNAELERSRQLRQVQGLAR